jgi:hypothetical protein
VLGLGLTNPFSLVTLCAVLAAHLALMGLWRPLPPRSALVGAAVALFVAAPFSLYSLLVFGGDPFWGVVYGQQNVIPSPPAPFLAIGFAPVLVLASLGLPAFLRGPAPERRLVLVWILLSVGLICVPSAVGFQRRFVFGVQPMLGTVAAIGLQPVLRWARRDDTPWRAFGRRMGRHLIVLVLVASTASFYGLMFQLVMRPAEGSGHGGSFQSLALRDAGRWLARVMGPDDVVLAEGLTGNYLAGVMSGRVYVGHPIGTLGHYEKWQAAQRFYLERNDQAALRFLIANDIRYVVYGPHERELGAAPLGPTGYLRLVYDTPEVSIYEVERIAAVGDVR